MIPLSSHVARSIREAVWCRQNGQTWGEARERIASRFGNIQPCNAVPNHGFIIIGWLYGDDFGDKLCKAVNCGFDTDCTGATLGALLGILNGSDGIPEKWSAAIGEEIVLHAFTGACDAPASIGELTERMMTLSEKSVAAKDGISLGDKEVLPDDIATRLFRNELARTALKQDIHAAVELAGDTEIWLHYNGEPVIRPGIGKEVEVSSVPGSTGEVDLVVPDKWECIRLDSARFRLIAREADIKGQNTVSVITEKGKVNFVVLGPSEAKGFGAGMNVPACPKCKARLEACMCSS